MTENQKINFNLNPEKTQNLFVDGCVFQSNERSITLNFSQAAMGGPQHSIVSRVTMTSEQAKTFLKDMNDHIEKFER